MHIPMRWLAVLATGGTVAGGGAALAHTPVVAASVKSTSPPVVVPSGNAGQGSAVSGVDAGIQQLLSEGNQLQAAIPSARAGSGAGGRLAVSVDRRPDERGARPHRRRPQRLRRSSWPPRRRPSTPRAGSWPPKHNSWLRPPSRALIAATAACRPGRQLAAESQQLTAEQAKVQQEAAALAAA